MRFLLTAILCAGAISAQAQDESSGGASRIAQELADVDREIEATRVRVVARDWLEKFGIGYDDPDAEIEFQVALRQEKPFALILDRCLRKNPVRQPSATELKTCIEFEEEVERRLGNPLD